MGLGSPLHRCRQPFAASPSVALYCFACLCHLRVSNNLTTLIQQSVYVLKMTLLISLLQLLIDGLANFNSRVRIKVD
ncbi:hypothetical protein V6Z12_D13G108900 [Gossypium hirsutum]